MAKETAEKKLLKLIESTQAQEAAAASGGQSSAEPGGAPAAKGANFSDVQQVANSVKGAGISLPKISLPPFLNQILGVFKGGSSPALAGQSAFGLRDINKFLGIGIAIVTGLLFLSFFSGWNESQKSVDFAIEQIPANTDEFTPSFRELTEYLDTLTRRNIFQPYEVKAAAKEADGTVASAATPINDKAKDLKLVGISWLDTPESASAMIENTQSGVTYFLKSGEQINSVTVKEIFADSIIIRFGDEEMEMRL